MTEMNSLELSAQSLQCTLLLILGENQSHAHSPSAGFNDSQYPKCCNSTPTLSFNYSLVNMLSGA